MDILITGGAGFIGSNLASFYLKKGVKVSVFDNFSREGSKKNIKWLESLPGNLKVVKADVSYNKGALKREIGRTDAVIHLAAQVAVTTSVEKPREDFQVNALGTFNVLEAIRKSRNKPPIIYSSTNKVYGEMKGVKVKKMHRRYEYVDYPKGINEKFPLDFYSPYGCSKGAADQYVHDYARIYDLKTVVFRQSCIYGPRQFGIEDQGWVAWFIIAALTSKPITIYGDGRQVRDLLFVEDLVRVFDQALLKIDKIKGEVFNIGGGPNNKMSVWTDFEPLLEKYLGLKIAVKWSGWRPGDQKIFVSDIRKAKKLLNWEPKVSVETGIEKLCRWAMINKHLFD